MEAGGEGAGWRKEGGEKEAGRGREGGIQNESFSLEELKLP